MANSSIESDDAFSRRLQAQELGNGQSQLGIDAQTPLMLDGRVSNTLCSLSLLSSYCPAFLINFCILFCSYNSQLAESER